MKQPDYRHIILFIIFGVTILIGVIRFVRYPSSDHAVIIVNKKTVSFEEFNDRFKDRTYDQDKNGLIQSMVLRELLVQEALKNGIQKSEDFIKSIKDHFEQSLAQAMVDQKYKSLTVDVEDAAIERYQELENKTLDLTVFNAGNLESIKQGHHDSEEMMSLPFDKLSRDVKYELLSIAEGHFSEPSCSPSEGCSVFRLDRIRPASRTKAEVSDRETIGKFIEEQKKERLMTQWLDSLKSKAVISLHDDSEKTTSKIK